MAIKCKSIRILCLCTLLLCAYAAGAKAENSLDFLYINANAGEAAGGHTAFRLGESVFHYQFFPDSTFLLVREPWESFRFLYNELHNRTISLASLPLDPIVYQNIRNNLTEILMVQQQFFTTLETAEKEQQLLRELETGQVEMVIPALGFFREKNGLASLNELKREVEKEYGEGFIREAIDDTENRLQAIVSSVEYEGTLNDTLGELLAFGEFVKIVDIGWELNPDAIILPLENEKMLSGQEILRLQEFKARLSHSIVELLQSSRPDKGTALLLQAARYLAVHYSLATGSLVSLDPFPEDVYGVKLSDEEMAGDNIRKLQKGMAAQAEKRRQLFFQESRHLEIAYSLLESSRGRSWELSRVSDTHRGVRILTKVTLPSRSGMVLFSFAAGSRGMEKKSSDLQNNIEKLQEVKEAQYGYSLVSRNCATELICALNSTFSDSKSGRAALGGWLEADSGLVFIPFLFYKESFSVFSLVDEQILTARRLRNLEMIYDEEDEDLLVWFRESNTITSTLYQPRSKDTPFLFFTDDSFLLRPLQGIMNMGYAALHGVAGIFTLPFDHGDRLQQAGRGVFYSLPELGFSNIRKGSYATLSSEIEQ